MAEINIVALTSTILAQSPALIDDVTGQISMPLQLTGQDADVSDMMMRGDTGSPELMMSDPIIPNHLAAKQYVDETATGFATQDALNVALRGFVTQAQVDALEAQIALLADQDALSALDASAVKRVGSTVTGPVHWPQTPVTGEELVNKLYVDTAVAAGTGNVITEPKGDARYLQLAGGALSGPLTLAAPPTVARHPVNLDYVLTTLKSPDTYLQVAGDSMEGPLLLPALPTRADQAVQRRYFDRRLMWMQSPIQGYMASGTIPVYLSALDHGGSTITNLTNKSRSGGQDYSAIATGAPLALDGPWWNPTNASYMKMRTPVDMTNKHVIMAVRNWTVTTASLLGGVIDGVQTRAYTSPSGNALLLGMGFQSDLVTPGTIVNYTTNRIASPAQNVPTIFELQRAGTNFRGVINGAYTGIAGSAALTSFKFDRLGFSLDALPAFIGQIADIVIIDMTKADYATAITTVRNWLAYIYSVTLRT